MINNHKKVNLLIVAHPDDEILGFGGTGAKLVNSGEIVQAVILSGKVEQRFLKPNDEELYANCLKANSHLGFQKPIFGEFPNLKMNNVDHIELVKFIESQILKFNPRRVFTHHPCDLNDDHKQISFACQAAARFFQRQKNDFESNFRELYLMEILSSTDWSFNTNNMSFRPNTFFDITNTIDAKIDSLSKYVDVMRESPHPRSYKVIKSHSAFRGSQCKCEYAEAFELIFKLGM